MIQVVVYILLSAKMRAFFCQSTTIEMGGVSRYFSKVSGSGGRCDSPDKCRFRPLKCRLLGTVTNRERKMRTNFVCANFLNTPRGPGHPGKIPGTFQIPLFETQGRQTFEGEHHPFAWKIPTPPNGLRTPKTSIFVLFFLPELRDPLG